MEKCECDLTDDGSCDYCLENFWPSHKSDLCTLCGEYPPYYGLVGECIICIENKDK